MNQVCQKIRPKNIAGIILFFTLILLLVAPCSGLAGSGPTGNEQKNVLILNSYHPTFVWTQDQSNGIITILKKSRMDVSIRVEYLDWKNYPNKANLENLARVYKNKYGNLSFDVIVVTDDEALTFVIDHRKDIFGNAPVVFCGVNNYDQLMLAQKENVTGKIQEMSPEKTLDSIFMLFPSTNNITIFYENTETGRGISDRIRRAESSFSNRSRFTYITNITFDTMTTMARTLPPQSAIISAITRDSNGVVTDHEKVAEILSKNSIVPVFAMYDLMMGHGAIGGSVISGTKEGNIAGEMTVQILQGEPVASIPVYYKDATIYSFDQNQLDRFSVPASRLPEGSVVINRPRGIIDEYFWDVVAAIFIIIFLLVGIIVLAINIRSRKKAENELRQSEANYRNILENIQDVYYRSDTAGNLIMASPSWATLLGYDSLEECLGKNIAATFYLDPLQRQVFLKEVSAKGFVKNYEITFKRRDETPVIVATSSHNYYNHDGTLAGVEGLLRDITEKKHADEVIKASLEEKVILLREVHHRVNNNLQILISLMNLQSRTASEPKVIEALTESTQRIRAMSMVHEKLYSGSDLAHIDFAGYLSSLARSQVAFYQIDPRKVTLETTKETIMLAITTAIPLGLVMNELVSNALRHAFPGDRKGTIRITAQKTADRVEISISDDGVGLPEGFDYKNSPSLGLRLVNILTEQLSGTITLDRTTAGTAFTIVVKEKE